ncbi:MAG TPA: TolC family protein [Longimicrobiaceae bacterium]|nr:TolC family protein [Longimicrobiaceae bacterium]
MTAAALALLLAAAAPAQDTLRLPALQEAALRRDPRARQLALQKEAARLRLRSVAVQRLPQLGVGGTASHQSEVPALPVSLPGVEVPEPPKDRWEATLDVTQRLYDGGELRRRAEVEEAQLAVERAELDAALHPLRAEVAEAFFTAFLLGERLGETALLAEDLEARLALLRAQHRAGAALPGDTAALRAELLRVGQERDELAAGRRAALDVLGRLAGRPVGEADVLALPDLSAEVERARAEEEALRAHPLHAVFAARRERLAREAALVGARERPQLSAWGQLGYGRPGLRQFTDDPHEYWTVGVRLRWTPWDWGTGGRERALLRVRGETVDTEEAAFAEQLARQVRDELAAIDRLRAALETDERIIALRGQVERQARAQLAERAITPAAYVAVRADLQEARLARQRHRVELERARAGYLTTLGVAPR